jgi:hypothetical protein
MLVFPKKEHEAEVRALLERWELAKSTSSGT